MTSSLSWRNRTFLYALKRKFSFEYVSRTSLELSRIFVGQVASQQVMRLTSCTVGVGRSLTASRRLLLPPVTLGSCRIGLPPPVPPAGISITGSSSSSWPRRWTYGFAALPQRPPQAYPGPHRRLIPQVGCSTLPSQQQRGRWLILLGCGSAGKTYTTAAWVLLCDWSGKDKAFEQNRSSRPIA